MHPLESRKRRRDILTGAYSYDLGQGFHNDNTNKMVDVHPGSASENDAGYSDERLQRTRKPLVWPYHDDLAMTSHLSGPLLPQSVLHHLFTVLVHSSGSSGDGADEAATDAQIRQPAMKSCTSSGLSATRVGLPPIRARRLIRMNPGMKWPVQSSGKQMTVRMRDGGSWPLRRGVVVGKAVRTRRFSDGEKEEDEVGLDHVMASSRSNANPRFSQITRNY